MPAGKATEEKKQEPKKEEKKVDLVRRAVKDLERGGPSVEG